MAPEESQPATHVLPCPECDQPIEADDLAALGDAFLAHIRARHNWPFGDQGIRNMAEMATRMTGSVEPVDNLGEVVIHAVAEDRIDDLMEFFERTAFVDQPHLAQCYCLAPHPGIGKGLHWTDKRTAMVARLGAGDTFGYLAYVDGRPAAWVNASPRATYNEDFVGNSEDPAEGEAVGVSCFVVAPPYRKHGLAAMLLDHVLADAARRGATWVEGYPSHTGQWERCRGFPGMFEQRGFEPIELRHRDRVVRRRVR